jgi:hypothetical protein
MPVRRFQPNRTGMTELAKSERLQAHLLTVGEHWATRLREIAPYSGRHKQHYRDHIEVEIGDCTVPRLQAEYPRKSVFVVARVDWAAAVEYGNKATPNPSRPLHKILDEAQAADPKFKGVKGGQG